MFARLNYLVQLSHSHRIARRYFVTNGFDGVLAMLGLLMGFRVSGSGSLEIMISACIGAAVALFMSGLTSAYISEAAEKERELRDLEKSMLTSLSDSAHADAARFMPFLVAAVNGLSPLILALVVLTPLLLAQQQRWLEISPLDAAIAIAMFLAFMLGVFLGRLSGRFWLWTGLRALVIALLTSLIILLLNQFLMSA